MKNKLLSVSQSVERSRLDWVDANKGLAIIIVVIYHVTMGLEKAGVLLLTTTLQYFWLFVTALATPAFFLMSGYFIEKSLNKSGIAKFLTISMQFILYPYILWTAIQQSIKMLFSNFVNTAVDSLDPLAFLLQPTAQFWFLHALFFAQILFLLYYRMFNRHHLVVGFSLLFLSWGVWEFTDVANIIRAFGFLVLGAWLGRQKEPVMHKLFSAPFVCIYIIVYLLSILLYMDVMLPYGFDGITNFLGGISVTLVMSCLFFRHGSPLFLAVVGKYSMYIFVLHIMCLVPVRVLFGVANFEAPILLVVLSVFAGVGIPILAAVVMEKLGMSTYLGIKPVNYSWKRKPVLQAGLG